MSPQTIWVILVFMRKCAHVTEYAILALLLWRALRSLPAVSMKMSMSFGAALLGCTVFAAMDEFHQSFVKSRTPSVHDVLLDVAGALLGLLIGASLARRHFKKRRGAAHRQFVDAQL
jgi:VanZ family protein